MQTPFTKVTTALGIGWRARPTTECGSSSGVLGVWVVWVTPHRVDVFCFVCVFLYLVYFDVRDCGLVVG